MVWLVIAQPLCREPLSMPLTDELPEPIDPVDEGEPSDPPVVFSEAAAAGSDALDADCVRLEPSALRNPMAGPVPFKPRAFGAASGRIVMRQGQLAGTLEVDGVRYPFRDDRSDAGRDKHPLARFGDRPFIFCFWPVDAAAALDAPPTPPLLRLAGLRKALEDPGLVEVIGRLVGQDGERARIAIDSAVGDQQSQTITLKGCPPGVAGDRLQAFARLTAGELVLERAHVLASEPTPDRVNNL